MSSDSGDNVLKKVMETVRAFNALASQDVEFHKSIDTSVANSLEKSMKSMASVMNNILLSIDNNNEKLDGTNENLEEVCKEFSNVMDVLFEKADRSLDILNRKSSTNDNKKNMQFLDDVNVAENDPSRRISKPQLNFKTPVDNSESHPFKPLLIEKPNALKSIEESTQLVLATEDIPEHFQQPYEYEILNQEYNNDILEKKEPIPSTSWVDTNAIWVDNINSLQDMMQELKKSSEIAVDLEHHDFRSYYGLVCLMQISTRTQDYIVDTIALRDDLKMLNEVFTNPLITKVFHGAFMDIIWLQRDLGLYIVSLFDTFHASKALGLPKHSLAYLLEKYANFKTSKKYQLADWRRRPLSKAMMAYARADTHFLLNIFDQMRNGLISSGKLAGVLRESRNVALRRFEYSKYKPKIPVANIFTPVEKESPWRTLMYQYNIPVDKEPLIRELYEWRDMMARRDDESPRYVMPNQLLVSLVAYGPVDPISVVSVSSVVTDHVRRNSKTLANLIKKKLEEIKLGEVKSINNRLPSSLDVSQDELQFLPSHKIELMTGAFKEIENQLTQATKSKQAMTSSVVLSEILLHPEHAVKYHNGSACNVEESELKDRYLSYIKATLLAASKNINMVLETSNSNAPLETEETHNKKSDQIQVIPEKQEDMDEIVVLKKKKIHSNDQKAKHDDGDIVEEPVDYSKANILASDNREVKKKDKKRVFDPYSSTGEGPKAAKKRRLVTKGKKISFKK